MAVRPAIINVMAGAAFKTARQLVHDFGEVEQLQVSRKGPAEFVSAADLRAEETLIAELHRARPDYGILSEEAGETRGADEHHRWIIDPLDGTTNFLHGIPHFCISLAVERDGEAVTGVIYDPVRDEMFWAERGAGAFMNNRRLRVSGRRQLTEAVIATGIPFATRMGKTEFVDAVQAVMPATAGIRRFGSAALDLAYVAAGRYDGFWELGLNIWDIAAGIVIVREAGGHVSEVDGGANMLASGSILAANGELHQPLGKLLRDAIANGGARPAS